MADNSLPAFNHETRAKYTESPNPTFSYGKKVDATEDGKKWVEGEKAGWTVVDPSKEEPQSVAYVLVVLRSSICAVCYAERSLFSPQQEDCEQIAWFSARVYPHTGLTNGVLVVCAHDQRDRAPPHRVRLVRLGERRREPRAFQVCNSIRKTLSHAALPCVRLGSLAALTRPNPVLLTLPFPSHPNPTASLFNQVSHSPPLISISVAQLPDGGLKDTAANIKRTKGFTVNLISEPFIENANVTSIDSPPKVGEWGMSGLTNAPSVSIPCRVMLVCSR